LKINKVTIICKTCVLFAPHCSNRTGVSEYFGFSISIIPSLPRMYSFIHHQCYIISEIDIVINTQALNSLTPHSTCSKPPIYLFTLNTTTPLARSLT